MDDIESDDTVIVLQNPVIMSTNVTPNGTFIKVKPWMELPEDDIFMIRLDKVITMTESKDQKLINLYKHYNNDNGFDFIQRESGLIKPNQKMGYISSVQDARQRLEKVFKLNQET